MSRLQTQVNTRSDEFQANRESMAALVGDLREKVAGIAEGGGELNWALLEHDLVDELHVTVAPTLLGGRDAPTLLEGTGLTMADQRRLRLLDLHREGDELYLRYAISR